VADEKRRLNVTEELYHYSDCGLPNVYLRNGFTVERTPYGEGVAIHDMDELHAVIARSIIFSEDRMTGAEMRFLRIEMDISQSTLANILKTSVKNVERWESNRDKPLKGPEDFGVKALYVFSKESREGRRLIDRIAELDQAIIERRVFEFEGAGSGWHEAA